MWSHADTDQFISLWTSLQVDSQPMLNPIEKTTDIKKKTFQQRIRSIEVASTTTGLLIRIDRPINHADVRAITTRRCV